MPKTSRFIDRAPLFPLFLVSALAATPGLLTACGDDDAAPPPVAGAGGGDADAGEDSGAAGTGGDPMNVFELGGPCLADEDTIATYDAIEDIAQAAPSLNASRLEFSLAHAATSGCSDSLMLATVESDGDNLSDDEAIDECTAIKNAVSEPIGERWLLAWLDNRSGGSQVFATSYDPRVTPPMDPPTRTALSSSSDRKGALALRLLANEEVAVLAWAEMNSAQTQGAIKLRVLNAADGAPTGNEITLQAEADTVYGALTLTALPSGGALLGYAAGAGEIRNLFIQRLSNTGAAVGEPHMLRGEGDRYATLSLAMRDELQDRGAVVYSVNPGGARPDIRFQVLDQNGEPTGDFRSLGSGFEVVNGVSITTNLSGYAIAYRAISDFNWDIGRVRVGALNETGSFVGDGVSDVAAASDYGGPPSIAVALDGRSMVSWFDDDAAGNRVLKMTAYVCRE